MKFLGTCAKRLNYNFNTVILTTFHAHFIFLSCMPPNNSSSLYHPKWSLNFHFLLPYPLLERIFLIEERCSHQLLARHHFQTSCFPLFQTPTYPFNSSTNMQVRLPINHLTFLFYITISPFDDHTCHQRSQPMQCSNIPAAHCRYISSA